MSTTSNITSRPTTWLTYVAFANIFIIWGSTFLAIVYALKGFPPFLLSGLRFFVAGVLLLGWQLARGERMPSRKDWGKNIVSGILILGGGTGLIAWSEQYVSSSEAAIVSATAPFWFMALDFRNWKSYLRDTLTLLGLVIGFGGLLLFLDGSMSAHVQADATLRWMAFVLLAVSAVSWVLGSLFSKKYPTPGSAVTHTAMQLLAGGGISLLAGLFLGEWNDFSFAQVPADAWAGLAFLIFMGSIVAYLSYVWLLGRSSPVLVSVHTYVNPVVAVLIGWLFLGETVSGVQLIGLGIILAGVLLTNLSGYRPLIRLRILQRNLKQRLPRIDTNELWQRAFGRIGYSFRK